jgi:hypothetical protein
MKKQNGKNFYSKVKETQMCGVELVEQLIFAPNECTDFCEWRKLDGNDWVDLLTERTEYARKCHWHKLNGWNWACLLSLQPKFACKCDWSRLRKRDWKMLLMHQPQFKQFKYKFNKFSA